MKLQHNLGGLEGLGPVGFEKRVFVAPWEERVFGIHVAMMGRGIWTWAELRKGAEAMNPFEYFEYRYYEKWLGGISQFLIDEGYIAEAELDVRTSMLLDEFAATSQVPSVADPAKARNSDTVPSVTSEVIDYLCRGDSPRREDGEDAPRMPVFKTGDEVRALNPPPAEHTRLPGHLRSRVGEVEEVYEGQYAYLSAEPDGIGPPQPVYRVRFDPHEVWGDRTEAGQRTLYADLYECYLESTG